MPNQIEFMDCPHCGKRVRTTAERCHRCGESTSMRMRRSESFEGLGDHPRDRDRSFDGSEIELGIPLEGETGSNTDGDSITHSDNNSDRETDHRNGAGQSHHAATWGGHDSEEDDFDYDEFLEKEFGSSDRPTPKPWWWYVAWAVLFVMVVGILVDAITLVYPRPS